MGTPRQAGTACPFTSACCGYDARGCCTPGRRRRWPAGGPGRSPGPSRRWPAASSRSSGVGGPLRVWMRWERSALCSRPMSRVVDQLVLLALAQRLDGQPELLLDLVHRLVVEVGDAGVDAQHRLGDAQLVLPRRQLVLRRTCRAAAARPCAPRPASMDASPCSFCGGHRRRAHRLHCARSSPGPVQLLLELLPGQGQHRAGGDRLGRDAPGAGLGRRPAPARRSGHRRRAEPTTEGSSPYFRSDLVDLAVGDAGPARRPACPASTISSPGRELALGEPVRQRVEHLGVLEGRAAAAARAARRG